MPRDRVDGIKTYEGRVVYDREKHQWTIKDYVRILKKIDSTLVHITDYEDCELMELAAHASIRIVGKALDKLTSTCYFYDTSAVVRELKRLYNRWKKLDRDIEDEDESFGGGGATRPF